MRIFIRSGLTFLSGIFVAFLEHALAKFQPAMTCNSQNTSQKHQKYTLTAYCTVLLYTRYPHCSIFLYLARVITHVIKQLLSNALLRMHGTIKLTGKERVEEVSTARTGA